MEIKSKSYTLRSPNGTYLWQIVITTDWFFSAISEYWNFSFAWRYIAQDDFREFLSKLEIDYFWWKMYQGMSYVIHNKKVEKACNRFSEMILPTLRECMIKDLKENPKW